MLNSFNDFLVAYPKYKNICANVEMENIYENILSLSINIIKMVNAVQHNITPIAICAKEIEAYIDSLSNATITLDRSINQIKADNNRQALGSMVAFILKPFGFEKIQGGNRPIPALYKGNHLYSGARYAQTGIPTMEIVQTIVPIK